MTVTSPGGLPEKCEYSGVVAAYNTYDAPHKLPEEENKALVDKSPTVTALAVHLLIVRPLNPISRPDGVSASRRLSLPAAPPLPLKIAHLLQNPAAVAPKSTVSPQDSETLGCPVPASTIKEGTQSFLSHQGLTITLADLPGSIEAPEVGVPTEDVKVSVIDDPSTTMVKDVTVSMQVPEEQKIVVDEALLVGNAVDVKVDELPVDGLIEVRDAMKEANEVFNRVKSEKIAEQALCSIRNDQQQYEGLAKEIVGKAIKQKERERANRASAAASRAKVMRYQTELESRLNRVEAERNAYRKELHELKSSGDMDKKETADLVKQFNKLQGWLRKMEMANGDFVRSIIAQDEMEVVFGEKRKSLEEGLNPEDEEEGEAKKPRL